MNEIEFNTFTADSQLMGTIITMDDLNGKLLRNGSAKQLNRQPESRGFEI